MKKMTVALSIIVAFVLSFSLNADARPVQAQAKNWTEYFNSPEFKAKRAEAYQQMFGSYPKGWTAENNKKNRKKIQLVGDGTHQFSRPEYLQMVAEAAAKYEEAKERSGPGLGANTAQKVRRIMAMYEKEIDAATSRFPNVSKMEAAAVILYESGGKPTAVSKAGARGLMQLMPGTAAYLKVNNTFNPAENIRGGVQYLSQMKAKFPGDPRRAYIAYWAGPGRAYRYGINTCKYAMQVFTAQQAVIRESMLACNTGPAVQ